LKNIDEIQPIGELIVQLSCKCLNGLRLTAIRFFGSNMRCFSKSLNANEFSTFFVIKSNSIARVIS